MEERRFKRFGILLAGLAALAGCTQPQNSSSISVSPGASQSEVAVPASPQTHSSPASFDFYLLNLSWSPEFCQTHPTAPECASHPAFVLHGLWPERSDGTYPENCSNVPGPSDPGQYKDIYPDQSLLQHEWSTHGTCSGLSPDAFFTAARSAYNSVHIPTKLTQLTSQISLSPNQIATLFLQANPNIPTSGLAISCGNNYLTAVEVCLDKSLQPTGCGALRSCRANTVRIPNP